MAEELRTLEKHTEGLASILIPAADPITGQRDVFLNPAQEYNRDLSVVAILTWSEINAKKHAERKMRFKEGQTARPRKKRKLSDTNEELTALANMSEHATVPASTPLEEKGYEMNGTGSANDQVAQNGQQGLTQRTFTCFEGLAASGLRSIRYAKEIPLLSRVIANDLSASAVESIREHIKLNGLGAGNGGKGKVEPRQGDCIDAMYAHRHRSKRFDVVDLDPYGTAAPFLDAAVQAVADGGLLCVTCTDMAVLAGGQYPEKSFSNYGGIAVKAEFSHEAALRLVLHAISSCAIRYGRYITPVLSLSIDFYVRVFVQIDDGPAGSKKASSLTGLAYTCHGCQASHPQPLARAVVNDAKGANVMYKAGSGPSVGARCDECGGTFAMGGPLWLGPLHDDAFIAEMVRHVEQPEAHYGTRARMQGMLAVARSEIAAPFYVTASRLASNFRCTAPSLASLGSALLHAGYDISRSHAAAGSIKTTAPSAVIHDIMRAWVLKNPVKMDNIKEGSPARALLAKAPTLTDVTFDRHPDYEKKMLSDIKITRYQDQPAGHGPMALAKGGKGRKQR